jgi:hypothetical protein
MPARRQGLLPVKEYLSPFRTRAGRYMLLSGLLVGVAMRARLWVSDCTCMDGLSVPASGHLKASRCRREGAPPGLVRRDNAHVSAAAAAEPRARRRPGRSPRSNPPAAVFGAWTPAEHPGTQRQPDVDPNEGVTHVTC